MTGSARAFVSGMACMVRHLVTIIIVVKLSISMTISDVDLDSCYLADIFCFGFLGDQKSVGKDDGCIKDGNCEVLFVGQYISKDKFLFTLRVKWSVDYSSTVTHFSISQDSIGFKKKYFEGRFSRQGHITECSSIVHDEKREILDSIYQAGDVNNTKFSVYYLDRPVILNREVSLVVFRTKSFKLYHHRIQELQIDLLNNLLYIHIKHFIRGGTSNQRYNFSVSTTKAILLFAFKAPPNFPISVKTTTTAMNESPATTDQSPTIHETTLNNNDNVYESSVFARNKKPSAGIIIGITLSALILITVIGIILYICLSTRNSRKIRLPPRVVDKTNNKAIPSGNYKKKFNEINYDDQVKREKARNNKTMGETTITPDDQYSTYFK